MPDACSRRICRTLRAPAVVVVFSVLCSTHCLASADICAQPNDYSHLSLAYHDYEGSAFSGDVGRIDRQDYDFDLQLRLDETWQFGVGHRYVIAGADQIELQTNDHLHTLFFPLHRQVNSDSKGFRISIAPAITASFGRLLHNRYAVTLLDDSRARLSDASVSRVGAALEWRF